MGIIRRLAERPDDQPFYPEWEKTFGVYQGPGGLFVHSEGYQRLQQAGINLEVTQQRNLEEWGLEFVTIFPAILDLDPPAVTKDELAAYTLAKYPKQKIIEYLGRNYEGEQDHFIFDSTGGKRGYCWSYIAPANSQRFYTLSEQFSNFIELVKNPDNKLSSPFLVVARGKFAIS